MNRERVADIIRKSITGEWTNINVPSYNKCLSIADRIIAEEGNGANLCSVCGHPSCSSRGKGFTEKCSVWQPQQPKAEEGKPLNDDFFWNGLPEGAANQALVLISRLKEKVDKLSNQPQQPKLPEKLGKNNCKDKEGKQWAWQLDAEKLLDKINEILDYLKARE